MVYTSYGYHALIAHRVEDDHEWRYSRIQLSPFCNPLMTPPCRRGRYPLSERQFPSSFTPVHADGHDDDDLRVVHCPRRVW